MVQDNRQSAWAPLRQPTFRAIWLANVVSNIGGWMQAVAAAWLMTSLTTSPVLVAMVQSASSLPTVVLALPAGALADIADRRRILLASQFWMMSMAVLLTLITFSGKVSPVLLLGLTAALAIGNAMTGPAFQAVVTELVPAAEVGSAVALNSAGFNLARAIGPAIGGIILAKSGAGLAFGLNAASFLAVIAVLLRWRSPKRTSVLPAERFVGAMRAAIRYVRYAPKLQTVLGRAGGFILFASGVWALLPLVVLKQLHGGPWMYGTLLGALGVGALLGTATLPNWRQRMSLETLVRIHTAVFGVVTVITALTRSYPLLVGALVAGGVAWITQLSLFNVAARGVVPSWVEARALAVYLLVYQGGTALGSLLWGAVAARIGLVPALLCAGAGLLLSLVLGAILPLTHVTGVDTAQASHWPEPPPVDEHALHAPALVTVEYKVDPARAAEFEEYMHRLSTVRRREGALYWALFIDPSRAGAYFEHFLVESWLDHLRQHERVTADDWQVQETIRAMQIGGTPKVSHYFAQERR
jgi:MFS family permease